MMNYANMQLVLYTMIPSIIHIQFHNNMLVFYFSDKSNNGTFNSLSKYKIRFNLVL